MIDSPDGFIEKGVLAAFDLRSCSGDLHHDPGFSKGTLRTGVGGVRDDGDGLRSDSLLSCAVHF